MTEAELMKLIHEGLTLEIDPQCIYEVVDHVNNKRKQRARLAGKMPRVVPGNLTVEQYLHALTQVMPLQIWYDKSRLTYWILIKKPTAPGGSRK